MTRRPWGIVIWQNTHWVPMFSLGIHVDFHTPTLDLHLPFVTVQIGRNAWQGGRLIVHRAERWSGHTDNCDHPR